MYKSRQKANAKYDKLHMKTISIKAKTEEIDIILYKGLAIALYNTLVICRITKYKALLRRFETTLVYRYYDSI